MQPPVEAWRPPGLVGAPGFLGGKLDDLLLWGSGSLASPSGLALCRGVSLSALLLLHEEGAWCRWQGKPGSAPWVALTHSSLTSTHTGKLPVLWGCWTQPVGLSPGKGSSWPVGRGFSLDCGLTVPVPGHCQKLGLQGQQAPGQAGEDAGPKVPPPPQQNSTAVCAESAWAPGPSLHCLSGAGSPALPFPSQKVGTVPPTTAHEWAQGRT